MKKVIIVGGGLAGSLTAALLQETCDVTLFTKKRIDNCNSMLAQGGVAVAIPPKDDWRDHYQDTVKAGVFHNNPETTTILVENGAAAIQQLVDTGLKFDLDNNGDFQFGLEGAHGFPRILHCAGDQTGKYMTIFAHQQLHKVTLKENQPVTRLVISENRCVGVEYYGTDGMIHVQYADAVVLATGGIGGLYPLTTNDGTITGDGAALALRAGVQLSDMEFVQFHPTLLTINGKCYGLVSEAVRGAGGRLIDENGCYVMADVHEMKDLAPRDVVARTLTEAYQNGHEIFLDISQVQDFETHFPQITGMLDQHGIPFRETKQIPVRPGAHFMMGVITTDKDGRTLLPGLYAVGEAACTGVHGANRLASNSLLECVVFSKRAATAIEKAAEQTLTPQESCVSFSPAFVLPDRAELQRRAWEDLGIQRDPASVTSFICWLKQFTYQQLPQTYTIEALEIANLCLVAEAVAHAALARKESLGAHSWKGQ